MVTIIIMVMVAIMMVGLTEMMELILNTTIVPVAAILTMLVGQMQVNG